MFSNILQNWRVSRLPFITKLTTSNGKASDNALCLYRRDASHPSRQDVGTPHASQYYLCENDKQLKGYMFAWLSPPCQ
jgi:hypothetical protein